MPKRPNPLAEYIDEVIQTRMFKTRKQIAQALRMKESTFSKSVNVDGTLTVEQCIRLAGLVGVPVPGILQLTGRHELAKLATQMLSPSGDRLLSKYEWELISLWRQLTETGRQALYAVGRNMRRAQGALSGPHRTSGHLSLAKRIKGHERVIAREQAWLRANVPRRTKRLSARS